jgi:hypothetical protein
LRRDLHKEEKNKGNIEEKVVIFRDFREFGKNTGEEDRGKIGEEDDFIDSVFKEVVRKNNEERK